MSVQGFKSCPLFNNYYSIVPHRSLDRDNRLYINCRPIFNTSFFSFHLRYYHFQSIKIVLSLSFMNFHSSDHMNDLRLQERRICFCRCSYMMKLIKIKIESIVSLKEEVNVFLLDLINTTVLPFGVLIFIDQQCSHTLKELSMIHKSL